MTEYNEAVMRELNQQLWHLLSPVDEDDHTRHILEGAKTTGKFASDRPSGHSRPLTGVKDMTGRKVLYDGKAAFKAHYQHQNLLPTTDAEIYPDNVYCGESQMGLPHGQGAKRYSKTLSWNGILLPYGSILDKGKKGPGGLVSMQRYALEVGVLQRIGDCIVFTDGNDVIESYEHCSSILERLRYIQKYGAIGLILVCQNDEILNKIASEAIFSAMFEHFTIPVVGVTEASFQFHPRQWPHPSLVDSKFSSMISSPPSFDSLEDVGSWVLEPSDDKPMSLEIVPKGKHFRDKRGCFPVEPIGTLKVTLDWTGTELYVGSFMYGKKHGIGAYVRANGEKMVTNFENGYAHGKGYLYWPNGDMLIGNWLHGKQIGSCEVRTRVLVGAAQVIQEGFRCHMARAQLRKNRIKEQSKQVTKSTQLTKGS